MIRIAGEHENVISVIMVCEEIPAKDMYKIIVDIRNEVIPLKIMVVTPIYNYNINDKNFLQSKADSTLANRLQFFGTIYKDHKFLVIDLSPNYKHDIFISKESFITKLSKAIKERLPTPTKLETTLQAGQTLYMTYKEHKEQTSRSSIIESTTII